MVTAMAAHHRNSMSNQGFTNKGRYMSAGLPGVSEENEDCCLSVEIQQHTQVEKERNNMQSTERVPDTGFTSIHSFISYSQGAHNNVGVVLKKVPKFFLLVGYIYSSDALNQWESHFNENLSGRLCKSSFLQYKLDIRQKESRVIWGCRWDFLLRVFDIPFRPHLLLLSLYSSGPADTVVFNLAFNPNCLT